ncbi:MAG TPA: metallophosphoesterase [Candidatus Bathyarchaeia archaeon]|nr:metallophosphoesterase [Candidatus Bathyarchaeia archaeon]HLP49009.1 metallophosphoesterase [Candidatus Kapabacteria bacterium]
MKFAIITDIHMGPDGFFKGVRRKIGTNVVEFVNNFIETMNNEVKPSFVVVLGDLIEDENPDNDKEHMLFLVESFRKLSCPVYFVAGNHDLKNISEDELVGIFKQDKLYYSFDSGELHFIVVFSRKIQIKGEGFTITDEQIEWLKEELAKTKKDCVIFMHASLAEQDLTGNPWFEGRPESCLILNRNEVRSIFENSGKVKAVFNSHLHWDKMHLHNSIPYFTLQSLVENEDDKGIPSQSYHVVNIDGKKVTVEVRGNYPKTFIHQDGKL